MRQLKKLHEAGLMEVACKPRTWEADAGRRRI
jgi:hypothetical protein